MWEYADAATKAKLLSKAEFDEAVADGQLPPPVTAMATRRAKTKRIDSIEKLAEFVDDSMNDLRSDMHGRFHNVAIRWPPSGTASRPSKARSPDCIAH